MRYVCDCWEKIHITRFFVRKPAAVAPNAGTVPKRRRVAHLVDNVACDDAAFAWVGRVASAHDAQRRIWYGVQLSWVGTLLKQSLHEGVGNENRVDVTTYHCQHITALFGGIVQRRVSQVVHNVDVASSPDQQLDAPTAFGRNGAMEKSISCVVAGASTDVGIGKHWFKSVWIRPVDRIAGVWRAGNRVDYAKHAAVKRTQVNRPNVPTLGAATRQRKTASREGDMLNRRHKTDVSSTRRDVRIRMDFARVRPFYRPENATSL